MTPSPSERKEILALVAANLTAAIREELDLDEIATLELSTAGQLLGLGPKEAARRLPVIEVGPRTRRVTFRALKEYQARNTKQPSVNPPNNA